MIATIKPGTLQGRVASIPSKSVAHRALICAALADGDSRIRVDRSSVDIDATSEALKQLGAQITREGDTFTVRPIIKRTEIPTVDAVESGSTLRFLLPVASALYEKVHFTGEGRLPERPLGPLLFAMRENGSAFSGEKLPFTITKLLLGGRFLLPGDVSSQFVSGLLMAAPILARDVDIRMSSPLESADYVTITVEVMKDFGVVVESDSDGYSICAGQRYKASDYTVEGDWSNAAFFLVAGALSGGITMTGLRPDSAQGDRGILEVLRQFGAQVSVGDEVRVAPGERRPITVDLTRMPDSLPILAVLAASATGVSRFTNGKRLRLKESDRLQTVRQMITDLGGHAVEEGDDLIVHGTGSLQGGRTSSFGDHRLAMAAAVASCIAEREIEIEEPMAVAKSYPDFYRDLTSLGGGVDV